MPLQVPDVCQQHRDAFSAAAVGFGTGHCKLGSGRETPSGPGFRRKGLSSGSATAQAGKNISRSTQKADPTPGMGETVPEAARETTASIQSHGDCGWWHVLVEEQRLAGRGGRGR